MRIQGAIQDRDGLWHLVGRPRCCTTAPRTAHRRRTIGELADPALIAAGQRCTQAYAVWPGFTGRGARHRTHLLRVTAALGDECTICHSRPGQVIDHDHLTGATRGYLDRECNLFVDRCRHLDQCPFADYLNASSATGLGTFPGHTKMMRLPKYRSRKVAFEIVMAGGVSPGVGHNKVEPGSPFLLEIPEGLPEPLPHR